MSLTAYERETVINLNDDEPVVRVWTAQRTMITRLRKDANYTEVETGFEDGTEWASFTCPKDQFRVGSKRQSDMTDEQKRALTERLQSARAASVQSSPV